MSDLSLFILGVFGLLHYVYLTRIAKRGEGKDTENLGGCVMLLSGIAMISLSVLSMIFGGK